MPTYYLFSCLLFIGFGASSAQNLVPNASFEEYSNCPKDYIVSYRKELVPGWFMPTGGTADYFNSCAKVQVGVPKNFMGNCPAKDGKAYAGIMVFMDPVSPAESKQTDYREYLQAKLTEPLAKGQLYRVTFYASLASNSTYAVNRLGAYLSEDKIGNRLSTRVLDYQPQICRDTSKIVMDRDEWFAVSDTFRAKGREQYLVIGNFFSDLKTKYQSLDLSGLNKFLQARVTRDRLSYYYIDLVSVCKVEDGKSH
jgi:OmpA-OmpF porin, OOP family